MQKASSLSSLLLHGFMMPTSICPCKSLSLGSTPSNSIIIMLLESTSSGILPLRPLFCAGSVLFMLIRFMDVIPGLCLYCRGCQIARTLDRMNTTSGNNLRIDSYIFILGPVIEPRLSCRHVERHKSSRIFITWSRSSDSTLFGPFYSKARFERVLLYHVWRVSRRPGTQTVLPANIEGDHIMYHDHNTRTPSCRREASSPRLASLLQGCGSPACKFS